MNPADDQRLLQCLEEIRDGQRTLLEGQRDALAMQREQLALVRAQFERADGIQDRAENLQERSAQVIAVARKSLYVVLPILFALIAYVSWLIFR